MKPYVKSGCVLFLLVLVFTFGLYRGTQYGRIVFSLRRAHEMLTACSRLFQTYSYQFHDENNPLNGTIER